MIEMDAEPDSDGSRFRAAHALRVVRGGPHAADRFGDLLGRAACMQVLFEDLSRIARSDSSVLIEGETGTGKELVAAALHRASGRARGPFIVFDCGAVSATLAESELFGHERGAFTGAVSPRAGVFELANGGTLFLDELGELPKALQPKLLRALETREVLRLGSNTRQPVDIRVLAATNRNLLTEVECGAFRKDLYFRIAAMLVEVPPLRSRRGDIPMLVEHFLKCGAPAHKSDDLPAHVWERLHAHTWPGNVRELQNAVQRLLINPEHAISGVGAPPGSHRVPLRAQEPADCVPLRAARRKAINEFERTYLDSILARTGGNVSRAAALAEVTRPIVQRMMRKHGL